MTSRGIPTRKDFTAKEWAVVQRHRTTFQVQAFLNGLPYNHEEPSPLRSFRCVIRTGTVHCLEAALAAAVILEQHGYPALLLDMESKDSLDHVVFLYKKDGRWGTIGRSRDPGLHGRRPVFKRIVDIVDTYFDPFIDATGKITGYGVGRLEDLGNYDWRFSERNVWKVERYLIDMRHKRYRSSKNRYERGHRRYLAYKQRYPDRKPVYFDGRRTWKPGYMRFR
jgi:hypothetical protein